MAIFCVLFYRLFGGCMNPLNSVLIEGNLVRDPQLTKTRSGTCVCSFSIATNRAYRQNDELKESVSYFDIEVWARLAENCSQYLAKGRGARVSGHLRQDRWENADGEGRSRVKIIGEHVEFLPGKRAKKDGNAEAGEKDEGGIEESEEVEESMIQAV